MICGIRSTVKPYSLEVVSHLKLVLLVGHVTLHLRVRVVDDGQEHVDQHEEHEEHKEHEEDRPQNTIGRLQLVEIKISQDDSEQSEAVNTKSMYIILLQGHLLQFTTII